MTDHANLFLDPLREAGLRITPQRQAICAYLANTNSHPTPYQVYEALSTSHPEISRATVYNTLNTLRDLGVIVEMSFGDGQTHYETDPSPHINLVCLRCHKIEDYPGPLPLGDIGRAVREEFGFQAVTAKAEVFGFCRECRQHKQDEIAVQLTAKCKTIMGAS
jgi:Fur family peroxide stress response transcriptional regulator